MLGLIEDRLAQLEMQRGEVCSANIGILERMDALLYSGGVKRPLTRANTTSERPQDLYDLFSVEPDVLIIFMYTTGFDKLINTFLRDGKVIERQEWFKSLLLYKSNFTIPKATLHRYALSILPRSHYIEFLGDNEARRRGVGKMVDDLRAAFKTKGTRRAQTVYRGVQIAARHHTRDYDDEFDWDAYPDLDALRKNLESMQSTFVSTSANKTRADLYANQCCLYELHLDRKVQYISVKKVLPTKLNVFAKDDEILLPPGLFYKPIGVRREDVTPNLNVFNASFKQNVFIITLQVTTQEEESQEARVDVKGEIEKLFTISKKDR